MRRSNKVGSNGSKKVVHVKPCEIGNVESDVNANMLQVEGNKSDESDKEDLVALCVCREVTTSNKFNLLNELGDQEDVVLCELDGKSVRKVK